MKTLWDGFCTAFSMYTILPVPPAKWSRESMRYALCFFPLAGVAVMLPALLWQYVASRRGIFSGLFAAVATLLPLIISGGIHMDGFLDTVDALSSHAPSDKKLEIMSDPHMGAFGVLGCAVYLLLSFGLWSQVYATPRLMLFPTVGYVLSRSLSGWGVAHFPCAKTSGLVYFFSGGASRRGVTFCCGAGVVLCLGYLLWLEPFWGAVNACLCLGCAAVHKRMLLREFGGNTGDLSGFLSQTIELLTLLVAAIGGILS